jgi:transposase
MIEPDKRKAIYLLHHQGMGIREIARRLSVNPNTVRTIIAQEGVMPETTRSDKIAIDPEVLLRLYHECQGRIQRVYEKITEEQAIEIGYSTLTRRIRELGIGEPRNNRCAKVPDEPGAEMQHDTTDYRLIIGGRQLKVVASLIYLRYCKLRYLKFYRFFNRFKMKCFFHEALVFWGYCALVCIIDNTNLARLRGTGKNAVICPEMAQFAQQYGFEFICHEKGHANRKG